MKTELFFLLVASEILSVICAYKYLFKKDILMVKIFMFIAIFIPLLGPILYLINTDGQPRDSRLNNTGARGDYTHNKILIDSLLEEEENGEVDCSQKK